MANTQIINLTVKMKREGDSVKSSMKNTNKKGLRV